MTPPPKTWKSFERRTAKWFGGKRRGADYGGRAGGKNDVIVDGFSVECKLYKRPTYAMILDAVHQAEAAKEKESDIAVAVIKRNGDRYDDALFVMSKEEFLSNFVSPAREE